MAAGSDQWTNEEEERVASAKLTGRLSGCSPGPPRQTAHDPGRVLTDLAVMIADGGEAISDIATLADQAQVFGPVASDSTCWRVLNLIGDAELDAIAAARAAARAAAWAQRGEQTGCPLPASLVRASTGRWGRPAAGGCDPQ